jgi:exodeoxyribonuclease VII large subunit
MQEPSEQRSVFTVSQITRRIKLLVESGFASLSLQGEISNFKLHSSGHLYFSLKDESAQISAVMWRSRSLNLSFEPTDGMQVVVTGRIVVYEPRGVYQIEVSSMRPLGVGELQMAFEKLKQKLAAEGLFDQSLKKPLPGFPEHIGIITSPTGAALHDMLKVFRRRFPSVELILRPVRVQGPGSAREIVDALDDFNTYRDIDIIILARGGGSLEDLWTFNEEPVARAIHRSRIPVVSAVGHEIDITVADFVADLRAPTPSAAAEMVVPDRSAILDIIGNYWYTVRDKTLKMLQYRKDRIRHLLESYAFNKPIDLVRQYSQRVDEIERSLFMTMSHKTALLSERTQSLSHRLRSLDPEMVVHRGYAIVYKNGEVVSSSRALQRADEVGIKFSDGQVEATVH